MLFYFALDSRALARAVFRTRSSGERLVTVTNVGGAVGQSFNEAYRASKFAL